MKTGGAVLKILEKTTNAVPCKLYYDTDTHTASVTVDNVNCISNVQIAAQNINDPLVIDCLYETAFQNYVLAKELGGFYG